MTIKTRVISLFTTVDDLKNTTESMEICKLVSENGFYIAYDSIWDFINGRQSFLIKRNFDWKNKIFMSKVLKKVSLKFSELIRNGAKIFFANNCRLRDKSQFSSFWLPNLRRQYFVAHALGRFDLPPYKTSRSKYLFAKILVPSFISSENLRIIFWYFWHEIFIFSVKVEFYQKWLCLS